MTMAWITVLWTLKYNTRFEQAIRVRAVKHRNDQELVSKVLEDEMEKRIAADIVVGALLYWKQ